MTENKENQDTNTKKGENEVELALAEIQMISNPVERMTKSNVIVSNDGYWFGKFFKSLQSIMTSQEKERADIVDLCTEKDSEGKPIPLKANPSLVNLDPSKIDIYREEITKLFEKKHCIEYKGPWKLNINSLTIKNKEMDSDGSVKENIHCLLSPEEILLLESKNIIIWEGI